MNNGIYIFCNYDINTLHLNLYLIQWLSLIKCVNVNGLGVAASVDKVDLRLKTDNTVADPTELLLEVTLFDHTRFNITWMNVKDQLNPSCFSLSIHSNEYNKTITESTFNSMLYNCNNIMQR